MAETFVYLRAAPGLSSIPAQQAAIRAAGIAGVDPGKDRAYLDDERKRRRKPDDLALPELDRCIKTCRPGQSGTVYVAEIGVLGVSFEDALAVVKAFGERGVGVHVVEDGKTYRWSQEGVSMLEFAQRIAAATGARRTEPGRRNARKRMVRTKAEQALAWERLREMWPAEAGYTLKQIEAETGIVARTAYNAVDRGELPPRNVLPHTGGPKMERAKPKPKRRPK